jgi:hypothetical protein
MRRTIVAFREDARDALARATRELASDDVERLKYAALELRMAIEALTYDRALAYKGEFPESEYETWQPKRVMEVLLEIDPTADKDRSIAFEVEPSLGEKPATMHSLGTETVLSMATIKDHYNALGSYLHVRSLKQAKAGVELNFGKMRKRCGAIIKYLEKVLSSPHWNSTLGNHASFDCECGARVRRRLPFGTKTVLAECSCGAQFDVEAHEDGTFRATPKQQKANCANADCSGWTFVPEHMARAGTWWICEDCGGRNAIRLGVAYLGRERQEAD